MGLGIRYQLVGEVVSHSMKSKFPQNFCNNAVR